MIDPNSPAFPSAMIRPKDYGVEGLTIRAYFAAMAMQGLLANSHGLRCVATTEKSNKELVATYASDAVVFADALIEALNASPRAPSYEEQQEGPQ